MARVKISSRKKGDHIRWVADVPPEIAGRRVRRSFLEEREAEAWAAEFEDRVKTHGTKVLDHDGKTVSHVLKKFYALKHLEGRHLSTARHVLTAFENEKGAVPIELISPLDLQKFWTCEEWNATSRAKAFRYLRLFFNWAERYDYLNRNPVRRVEPPKASDPKKEILTPERMVELLAIDDNVLRAFLCLGGFLGIRSSELLSLKEEDIEDTEIRVNAGHREERFVKRLPAFDRFWTGLPKFPSQDHFYEHVRSLNGGMWPANCLRHSFGSYHLAMWEDAGSTAFQMGNSEAVVRKSYARAVRKAAAEKWWSIGLPNV